MAKDEHSGRAGALEAVVVIPNVILLALVVLFLLFRSGPQVEPLIKTDPGTASRIEGLEQALSRDPRSGVSALELARLYSRVGEFPWSLDALRSAEQNGDQSPEFRMKLGLAYVELGRNLDGLRVLKRALVRCRRVIAPGQDETASSCSPEVKAKLEIFTRVAEILLERRIDARKNQVAAAKVFQEVLKPVGIEPPRAGLPAVDGPKAEEAPPASPPGEREGRDAPETGRESSSGEQ